MNRAFATRMLGEAVLDLERDIGRKLTDAEHDLIIDAHVKENKDKWFWQHDAKWAARIMRDLKAREGRN